MKKLVLVLMLVISMVSFSSKIIVSMGHDNVKDPAHPDTWIILNTQTQKYTLIKITDTPHGGVFGYDVGDEIMDDIFRQAIIAFDKKHPEGYNTGVKAAVYLKYKGKTYKEIDHSTLIKVLQSIGYYEVFGMK